MAYMTHPIKHLPVKLNANYEIVDAKGDIVIPCITWRGDAQHLKERRRIGQYVAECINFVAAPAKHNPPLDKNV